jgi:two-component system sensor histidine kinase RegB
MFLMPLAIAAASLPWAHTLIVALLTAVSYSLLIFFHVPLPAPGHGAQEFLVLAMWVNYLLCAGLIAYVVLAVAGRLREQNRRLAEIKRSTSAHEYLVRVGSLAADGHEIKSPLCTMAVLVEEMLQGDDHPALKQNLRVMSDQIRFAAAPCQTWRSRKDETRHSADRANRRTSLSEIWSTNSGFSGRVSSPRSAGWHPTLCDGFNRARFRPRHSQSAQQRRRRVTRLSRGELQLEFRDLRIWIEDRGPGIPSNWKAWREKLLHDKGDKGTGIGVLLARLPWQEPAEN